MTGGPKDYLSRNHGAKLMVNQLYVYLIHMLHVVLNLVPGFIRNPVLRMLLHRAGKRIYFDHNVYIKFPWLVEIGSDASINRGVEFYPDFFGGSRIVLGNNVRVGPHTRFHAAGHDTADTRYGHSGGSITVGDDVWIGTGVILLPGVHVGDRSVVGAGSVVSRDIPPDSVAVGVPARVIKQRDTGA
ncbi:MAG: acyltransferase [Leptospirillia bacterium]